MTNEQVIAAWINGKAAKSSNGNLSTDGDRLKSYALTIGFTDGIKVAVDYTAKSGRFYSVTTSSHVNLASGQAGETITPQQAIAECRVPATKIWTS